MEILDATLKELVAKEKNHNNLQEIYVKKLFPSFQQEFKNYDIHDIQNYENYNLQNILDDLRHIQTLLEESPDEKRFLAKKEFLVKLSQKILKKIEKDYPADPPASSKTENNKQESDVIQLPIIRKQKQSTVPPKKEQPKLERKSLTNDVREPVVAKEPEKVEVKEEKPAEPIVPQMKVDTKKRESVKAPKEVVKVEPKPVKVEERIEPKVEPKIEEVKPEEPVKKEEKVEHPVQVQVEEKEPVKEVMEVEPSQEEEDASKRKEPKNIIVKKGEKVQRPSSQDRKKRPISIKRKKSLPGREKLIMIDEEAVDEGSGAEEDDEKEIIQERPKKKMEFSMEQEKQIQEMSAQYGVEVEALKSYLETKAAHNQFNWMGIKRLERKVDINLEISKLEFEYERFVKRKDRYRSSKLAEIVSSPDSLPYLSKSHTALHQHQKSLPQNRFFGSYYAPENHHHKDPKSMTFGGGDMDWGAIDENFAETISNSLPGSPRSLNRMATIQSLTLTRDNSNQEQNLRNQGTLLQSKNVQEDHWSEVSYGAKSKGQVKLPSITSFNPSKKHIPTQTTVNAVSFDLGDDSSAYRRLNSTSEPNIGTPVSLVSPSYKAQLKMKRNSSSGYVHLPGLGEHRMMLNRIDTKISIEDSLSGELTNKHREYREFREPMSAQAGVNFEKKLTTETKKGLSQMNTTRSNYLMSLNSLAKPDYADSVVIDGFSTLRSTTGRTDVQLKGRDEYNRYNQDVTQFSRKGTEEVRGDGESFAMGATMQTISTKSMTSVYSQEAPSRFMSLRSMGSGMRVVEGDLEYYGTVKRINLLGSGSQAKVFLCEVKEFEQLVALKQYDANKSQYGGQSYEALKDEFHMLRQLDQENVIQYYCLYRSKRKTFSSFVEFGVIMEFMPGGSLEKYIETSFESITMKTKRSFIKQILKGLDCLHSNKIIHRDLKPANILLSEDQSLIKISDFGISTQTKNDNDMAKSIVGTPWYMAPEIINEETYSYKADIWSAGCCFIHLLTGNKPYHMANARQAMLLMANHNTPLESCDEASMKMIESHKGLKELLELCFSKDKDIRASASRLLESPFFEGV